MKCVYCGEKTKTANSRSSAGGFRTWRRRQCLSCGAVFTTSEIADLENAIRVDKNPGLEPLSYDKLFLDLYDSLRHRKNAQTDAKQLTNTVVLKLLPCKKGTLKDQEIAAAAWEVLKRFDKAAATYYAVRHIKKSASVSLPSR